MFFQKSTPVLRARRLRLEGLEKRELMAADLAIASFDSPFELVQPVEALTAFVANAVPGHGQNPNQRMDVNSDGIIGARDLLMIANDLLANGSHTLPNDTPSAHFLDVNGDGKVTPLDALQVADHLVQQQQVPTPEIQASLTTVAPSDGQSNGSGVAIELPTQALVTAPDAPLTFGTTSPAAPAFEPTADLQAVPAAVTKNASRPLATQDADNGLFLKLGNIKGDATDRAHLGWSLLDSFSTGNVRSIPEGAKDQQRTRGATDLNEMTVRAHIDSASVKIWEASTRGTFFAEAELRATTTVKSTTKPVMSWKLSNVIVSSFTIQSNGEVEFTLSYTKAEFTFFKVDPKTGAANGSVTGTFDQSAAKGTL